MAHVRRRRDALTRACSDFQIFVHTGILTMNNALHSQRAAWPPFFDDMNAVIFLAPISCFDEKLAEDRRVNRLEDSFLLWKAVCENKLLANTMLILFLNKCDLLEKKLNAGVKFKHYVPSFWGEEEERRADCNQVCVFGFSFAFCF